MARVYIATEVLGQRFGCSMHVDTVTQCIEIITIEMTQER